MKLQAKIVQDISKYLELIEYREGQKTPNISDTFKDILNGDIARFKGVVQGLIKALYHTSEA